MTQNAGLYLYPQQQSYYIKQIKDNYLIFEKHIHPIFNLNSSEEAEKYQLNRINGVEETLFEDCLTNCMDEYDYLTNIESETYRYYNFINDAKYRSLSMWICCTCQLWEQQLLCFLIQEINNRDTVTHFVPKKWKDIEKLLSQHGIVISDMSCWKIISELRDLVNVLKHSEGSSEKRLRGQRPDIFLLDGKDILPIAHTTLGEVVLNISIEDLKRYTEALIEFWNGIPVNQWIIKK